MKNVKRGLKLNKRAKKLLMMGIVCLMAIFIGVNMQPSTSFNYNGNVQYAFLPDESETFRFLSDLSYITTNNWSYVSWGSIRKDVSPEGAAIKLIVDGETKTFPKGMGMHANSMITYNISDLSSKYTRFVTKAGIDASRGSAGNGVIFGVQVSNDGETWTEIYKSGVVKGDSEALSIDVDIEGYKYLRIYANNNGNETSDHAVLGDARIVTADYVPMEYSEYTKIHPVSYYDEILSSHDADYNMENNYRLILEREFVNKLGYDNIQSVANLTNNLRATLDWLVSSEDNLEYTIEVGELASGSNFLNVISKLYATYGGELAKENGDVYKKMMFGISAAYTTDTTSSPLTFSHYAPTYDYVERYGIFKTMYDQGLFLYGNGFKEYHVEFFRIMMQDGSRNDELLWLNYIGKAKNYATGVYSYVAYISPNYSKSAKPHLYDAANAQLYEDKWHLAEYGVPFADDITRYWMVMQEGGICWNQARMIQAVFKMMGRPSIGNYQPSHEAALYYISENPDGTGEGYWNMAGNIFGWGSSSTKWYGGNRTRTLFGWSNKSFTNQVVNANGAGTSSGYVYLAQDNLNRYADYKESLYLNLLANSYEDYDAKISIYNKALEIDEINLDSYDYKIQAYKATNASSDEWYELANDIIDNYTFYPMAMHDLLEVIRPYLNGAHRVDIDQKEYDALVRGTKATAADNKYHWVHCTSIANAILKKTNPNLASFSFDGANAGMIVISSAYDSYADIQWHYSLDGGITKSAGTTDHKLQLSKEEIDAINAEDDIRIYIDGLSGDALAYTIDIVEGTLPTNLYGNDLENRVIGIDLTFEWRDSENDEWTSYAVASPNNTGDKTLYVRVGATGNKLPSESTSFNFTQDDQPDTEKYIPVNHLSISSYSSQSIDSARPYYAPNAIDGNLHTMWHTDFRYDVRQSDTNPFLIIELDEEKYISALEFVQQKYKVNDPDDIKDVTVYISENGEDWIEAGKIEDCATNDQSVRKISFENSIKGKYVKFEVSDTHSMFASVAMINLYEDTTKKDPVSAPTANVAYSISTPTNGNVVARLVNPSTEIEILNNGGSDTYTFTDNDSFTFLIRDVNTSEEGKVTAKVDWIDRIAPTGQIVFNTTSPTNKTVTATLKPSEDVIVTNNGQYGIDDDGNVTDAVGNIIDGYTADEKGNMYDKNGNFITNINSFTHDFVTNGEFVFEFRDLAGNHGSAVAKVEWIDTDAPNGVLIYDSVSLTNKDVTVRIELDEEGAYVTNNDGQFTYTFTQNGEFTFKFTDAAGNGNELTAKVDWIDKTAPTAEIKYERFGDSMIVRIINPSEAITFQSGNGVYTFDEDGTYDIYFYDAVGNVGKVTAFVEGLNKADDDNIGDDDNDNSDDVNTDNNVGTGDKNDGNNNQSGNGSNAGVGNSGTSNIVNNGSQNSANNSNNSSNTVENGSENIDDVNDSIQEDSKDSNDDKNVDNNTDKKDDSSDKKDEDQTEKSEKKAPVVLYFAIAIVAGGIVIVIIRKKNN